MASIKDVAAMAKVSISTVSLALNYPERVSDATKERIFAAIKQLHYTPAPVSKNVLYTGMKKKTVALLTSVIFGPYFFEVMRGINETLEASEIEMIIISGQNAVQEHFAHIVQEKVYSGMILIGDIDHIGEQITAAGENSYPVVTVNSIYQYPNVGSVNTDHYYSGQMMANHFLHIGYKDIGIIGIRTCDRQKRAQGFMDTLKTNGVTIPACWDIEIDLDEKSGGEAMHRLILENQKLPRAIFCLNDEVAIGAIKELQAYGLKVPQDVAIVGYDDIPICKYFRPELTSINTPKFELGVLAASSLLRQLSGKSAENIVMNGKLVMRESCGYKEKNRHLKQSSENLGG